MKFETIVESLRYVAGGRAPGLDGWCNAPGERTFPDEDEFTIRGAMRRVCRLEPGHLGLHRDAAGCEWPREVTYGPLTEFVDGRDLDAWGKLSRLLSSYSGSDAAGVRSASELIEAVTHDAALRVRAAHDALGKEWGVR